MYNTKYQLAKIRATGGSGSPNSSGGGLHFFTGDGSRKVEFQPDGDVVIVDGNLVIGTAGHGIDFSATSGTGQSELLDDYEEGEFNPSIVGSTSAGTGSNSAIEGHYTKIGNLVHIDIYINQTSHNGTGDIRIAGAPFTCKSGAQVTGSIMMDNVNFDDNYRTIVPHIWGGSVLMGLYGTRDNSSWHAIPMSGNTGSGPRYILSITYPAA